MMIMYFFGYFFSLIIFLFVRSHFLLCLLGLEYLLLYSFFFIFGFMGYFDFDYYFLIIYLVFGVCDGVLGLSLLVFLIRNSSSDYLDSLTLC
uniref:NADH-ubiquinone oxidoreductase chain 4L n=1 Tax=Lycorma meliae TaxID=130648 RepID=A0A7U3QRE1_9HEMI|nr:NADH dehydrogenase subunit 4L [Lycorma meliae]QPN53398.1 NADH dehydrogenase subunit 4L [Lycorma meliae]